MECEKSISLWSVMTGLPLVLVDDACEDDDDDDRDENGCEV